MSYTRSYHHIVFGTKFRQKCLLKDRRERVYHYIAKTIQNKKCNLIEIKGMEEHIHILVDLHPTVALADLVKAIKQSSSRWLGETCLMPFFEGWASEYYACSVSPVHVMPVQNYILNQQEHHADKDYGKEVKDFVEKMGMTLYQDDL